MSHLSPAISANVFSASSTTSESLVLVEIFADISPMVGCSIGVTHNKVPVVGVISQPFLNRIVSSPRDPRTAYLSSQLVWAAARS